MIEMQILKPYPMLGFMGLGLKNMALFQGMQLSQDAESIDTFGTLGS